MDLHIFCHGHPQLPNRQTLLVPLESTGPYQRNGPGVVFMRCVVFVIQLFSTFIRAIVTGNEISEVHESRTIV